MQAKERVIGNSENVVLSKERKARHGKTNAVMFHFV